MSKTKDNPESSCKKRCEKFKLIHGDGKNQYEWKIYVNY